MLDLSEPTRHKETKRFKTLDELRTYLAEDFLRFVYYANSHERLKTGNIQIHLAKKLQEGHKILEFLIFRNSTKTWLADLWIAWKLLCCPSLTFCIVSAKHDAGRKHMANLRRLFRTLPALSHLGWEIDNETSFRLEGTARQEPTLKIESIYSGSLTGSHVDVMILDDVAILQTEESELKRQKLRYILSSNVYPVVNLGEGYATLFKGGVIPPRHNTQILYLGTPWVQESILLFDKEKAVEDQEGADEGGHPLMDAHRVIVPAVNEYGESNFPEKYTRVQLEMQKRAMSRPSWCLHMLLDPTALDKESRVVDIENIIIKNVEVPEPIMTIDPAGEDGEGDEHAICIAGAYYTDKKTKINIKCVKGWNIKANDFVDEALKTAKELGVWRILIESRFNAYRTLFENKLAEMGNFASIENYNPHGNKQRRLVEILDSTINSGVVTFDPSILKDPQTKKQFSTWTHKRLPSLDDRLDAIAMSVAVLLDQIKNASEWTLDASQFDFGR